MSEVVSFGNIVNSLRAVRNDYNEHLKAVPQYEAFLLVETSTQSVADKLQGVAPAMAAEVVEALEAAKVKFRQHLTSVPEYRALLAIDKLIGDVAADLGVHAVATAPVEAPVEATTDAAVAPAEVAHPVEEQQVVAQAEATEPAPSEPVEVVSYAVADTVAPVHAEHAQSEVAAELPPVDVVAQDELRQPEAQAELTTADALSQIQSALQTADVASDVTIIVAEAEAEAEAGSGEALTPLPEPTLGTSVSSDPVHAEEFGHEAEKAA